MGRPKSHVLGGRLNVFTLRFGGGDLLATAIHNGHDVRPEVLRWMAIAEEERLREEDPYTGLWVDFAATSLVVHRSRFEVDLNRSRPKAVYLSPEDAWGLTVWQRQPNQEVVEESLADYDLFYAVLDHVISRMVVERGKVLVLDLHTYNHRRGGPGAPPADPAGNPDINLGTGSLDRTRWGPVVERLHEVLHAQVLNGRRLDVRENVRFQGGEMVRWIHRRFPESVCGVAIEVKKIFMDEWTGAPNPERLFGIKEVLRNAAACALEALHEC